MEPEGCGLGDGVEAARLVAGFARLRVDEAPSGRRLAARGSGGDESPDDAVSSVMLREEGNDKPEPKHFQHQPRHFDVQGSAAAPPALSKVGSFLRIPQLDLGGPGLGWADVEDDGGPKPGRTILRR